MCGIAVHLSLDGPSQPLGLELVRHRGPDSSGEWISPDGRCWLGATRLAIIDLSQSGAQPMSDSATGNVVVVNGEIYNHQTLRGRLGSGVNWRGTSDTETLLHGYARWGHDVVTHLKGMFAFAIYDVGREELFFARDRFGMKPLYYTMGPSDFRAGSEVRLLVRRGVDRINGESISEYLQWGACPEGKLLFSNIEALPAGHAMTIGREGKIKIWRYWPLKAFDSSSDDVVRRVRKLIDNAVEEHLLSDVPVASFLSGGIDSSVVTAVATRKLPKKLKTFSIGFDVPGFDETAIAQEVAERYLTEHHRIQLSNEEVCQSVTEAVSKLDLPSVDAINTYVVASAVAARGVKVALSGLGGDELFGGYPSFRDIGRLGVIARLPRALQRLTGSLTGLGNRLSDLPRDGRAGELAIWRRRFFTDDLIRQAGLPTAPIHFESPVELPDDFARVSWAELTGYMRRMLLRDADQMSMAVSLEVRAPFLDHELVEYVLGLPEEAKNRYRVQKGLLVEACRDLLPTSVYLRPKRGFVLPMKSWMLGPLSAFVKEGLDETISRNLLPQAWVNHLNKEFQRGHLHWTRVWSIVVLGHFAKRLELFRYSDEDIPIHSFS